MKAVLHCMCGAHSAQGPQASTSLPYGESPLWSSSPRFFFRAMYAAQTRRLESSTQSAISNAVQLSSCLENTAWAIRTLFSWDRQHEYSVSPPSYQFLAPALL